jgi:hypothetical protein
LPENEIPRKPNLQLGWGLVTDLKPDERRWCARVSQVRPGARRGSKSSVACAVRRLPHYLANRRTPARYRTWLMANAEV